MTENIILFGELCKTLTDHEANGSAEGSVHSDLYGLLVKIQTQWKDCLSAEPVNLADTPAAKPCGVLMDWLFGAGPVVYQVQGCNYMLLRVWKNADFDYLYVQRQYKSAGIKRGNDFDYAGVFCKKDGRIYDGQNKIKHLLNDSDALSGRSAEALRNDLKAAIREVVESVIDNNRCNLRITELSDKREIDKLAQFQNYAAEEQARKAYLSSDAEDGFSLTYSCSYQPEHWTEDSMLAYILDPGGYARTEAEAYIDNNQEVILSGFLKCDMAAAACTAIVENPSNPIHRVKRIIQAMSDTSAKTVNVTIRKDGKEFTFKAEAAQFRSDCKNYYSDWNIIAADRRAFEQELGSSTHYGPEDILRIEYARSVLYEEEVLENE